MIGSVEQVLRKRYARPETMETPAGTALVWNVSVAGLKCVLYKKDPLSSELRLQFSELERVYGDAKGGFLLGDSLKVSMIQGPPVYGLYTIHELIAQPEVGAANAIDPEIQFFMDSANVWYYGAKAGELYVFDAEARELECLGSFDSAFLSLLSEWEVAKA